MLTIISQDPFPVRTCPGTWNSKKFSENSEKSSEKPGESSGKVQDTSEHARITSEHLQNTWGISETAQKKFRKHNKHAENRHGVRF